jgi:hypothetical protein
VGERVVALVDLVSHEGVLASPNVIADPETEVESG